MANINICNEREKRFDDIEIGDCFIYDAELFVKIQEFMIDQREYNALSVNDARFYKIYEYTIIKPVISIEVQI